MRQKIRNLSLFASKWIWSGKTWSPCHPHNILSLKSIIKNISKKVMIYFLEFWHFITYCLLNILWKSISSWVCKNYWCKKMVTDRLSKECSSKWFLKCRIFTFLWCNIKLLESDSDLNNSLFHSFAGEVDIHTTCL